MGHGQYTSLWLPYSVASVWTYVNQFKEIQDNFEVQECIFMREEFEDVLARLDNPELCLFSHYLWNDNYNLELAKRIKNKWPECIIIFGGPQVDEIGFNFKMANPFVDSIVINEGEVSLHHLLNDYLKDDLRPIYQIVKRVDPAGLPSPFVDGDILQKVVDDNPGIKWATCLETNRGCPFKCSFCDWGSLTQSKIKQFDLTKVYREWDWIVNNGIEYVHIADANFGVFYDRDKEIVDYIVKKKKETDYPHNVSATWYKNSAAKMIGLAKILEEVNLNKGFTLSVQSMNEETLESIERKNMEMSKLADMYAECDKQDVAYYTEFILGLPFETRQTWREGLCAAIEAGCHFFIDVHPLEVLKNSRFAKQVTEFNYEVFKFTVVMPNQISRIPEMHNYVIASEFMSRQDYIDSWMWAWNVLHFHHYAWTQGIAKFARNHLGISYLDFYEDLLENCIKKDEFLNMLYEQQEHQLKDFFWNTESDVVFDNDNVIVVLNQIEWHKNRERVLDTIQTWAREYLKDLPNDLVEEVLKFSELYLVNKERVVDISGDFSYNINEVCNEGATLIKEDVSYTFKNKLTWVDDKDFKDKLFYKNRNGFSILKVERQNNAGIRKDNKKLLETRISQPQVC
jgi:radical SAM superfamily enzyme YgiQ (UPF0313 family)